LMGFWRAMLLRGSMFCKREEQFYENQLQSTAEARARRLLQLYVTEGLGREITNALRLRP